MRVVGGKIGPDGQMFASIVWTVPGGPAEKSGLQQGDKVQNSRRLRSHRCCQSQKNECFFFFIILRCLSGLVCRWPIAVLRRCAVSSTVLVMWWNYWWNKDMNCKFFFILHFPPALLLSSPKTTYRPT